MVATETAPGNAIAWARLAELQLSLGWRDLAVAAAEHALALDPDLARAHLMLGFAELTNHRNGPASASFLHAAALDPADPLARFDLGLARIRDGDLAVKRGEIDAAVALDSNRALLRSYLGEAYAEENRGALAEAQFEIARELDPLDPTPHLYNALRLQQANRPGAALDEIQRSIALNDNRAVYRGRLQIDQDEAARSASLGRIYDDLGFQTLGRLEAGRSLSLDPANAAAHRFLSDIYRGERRREISRVSELTRAMLLQDVNLNPLQPSVTEANLNLVGTGGPANAAFNEYTPLFEGDGVRFTGSGLFGNQETFGGEAMVSVLHGPFSFSAGAFGFSTDGFRHNFDVDHHVYNLFGHWEASPKLNVQFELRGRGSEHGCLEFNFSKLPPLNPFPLQGRLGDNFNLKFEEGSARFGLRFSPDTNNDTLVSLIYSDRDVTETDVFDFGIFGVGSIERATDGEAWQAEAQHIYQQEDFTLTFGGAYNSVQDDEVFTQSFNGFPLISVPNDFEEGAWRASAYATYGPFDGLRLTGGLSYDDFESTTSDVEEWSPKICVEWDATDRLRLRAAYAKTVKPPLVTNRTVEPTTVAGSTSTSTTPTAQSRSATASAWTIA